MDTAVLRTYLHVIDEGSFSAAARRMGISKSMASKHVSDLEARLGARLLFRSTRSVRPTELGKDYGERVRKILLDLEEADNDIRALTGIAAGRIRLGAPVSYSRQKLAPHVLRFIETYPEIHLELVLDDSRADIIGSGLDAVIRVGELEDSSLIARKLHNLKTMMVASPNYLQQFGTPLHPRDLVDHRILHYTNAPGSGTWPFSFDGEMQHVKIQPHFAANNGEILRSAALHGTGIARVVDFMVDKDLAEGKLVQVLGNYELSGIPVHLVYPAGRNMSVALRTLIDFIRDVDLGEA